jgi:hypothetical protein
MAVKTRSELNADNAALFVNNTTGNITPALEKAYNESVNNANVNRNGDTFEAGAEFEFDNNSKLREGAIDHGYGGGIAKVCANDKTDQWEDGFRYLIQTSGSTTVIYVENMNGTNPGDNDDETKSYAVGSRWKNLVTGIEYLCTQANEGDAIWQAQSGVINSFTATVDRAFTALNSCSLRYYRIGTVVYCTLYGNLDFAFGTGSPGPINTSGRIVIAPADLPIPTTTLIPTGIATLELSPPQGLYSNIFLNGSDIAIEIVSSDPIATGSGANYSASFSYEIN